MGSPIVAAERRRSGVPGAFRSRQSLGGTLRRRWLPILLFLVSLLTTACTGARLLHNYRLGLPPLSSDADFFPIAWVLHHPARLVDGWQFSLTLMAILLAHEGGHLLYCRKHGVRASWPFVLPAPTLSGTAGAVIRIRSRIPTRQALIEIGIAGPIAGFVVALPASILGILLSRPDASNAPAGIIAFHVPGALSILDRLLAVVQPRVPLLDHAIWHPVLVASWIGLFITSLNLIPAGQLDGGHILYALSPRLHRMATVSVPLVLLAAGLALWTGWLLWGAILLLPAMRHPRVPYFPSLGRGRWWLGITALAILLLTLLPAPFGATGLIPLLR